MFFLVGFVLVLKDYKRTKHLKNKKIQYLKLKSVNQWSLNILEK